MARPAVFLDRDGTLNESVEYLSDSAGLKLRPGVPEGVRALREAGFLIILISNQSGIGRGLFTWAQLEAIHARLRELLAAKGAHLDAIFFCPHRPEDRCTCRKPEPGLFQMAITAFEIDPPHSYMIGDLELDILPAAKLGCRTVLVPAPERHAQLTAELPKWAIQPDAVLESFTEAVSWILRDAAQRGRSSA